MSKQHGVDGATNGVTLSLLCDHLLLLAAALIDGVSHIVNAEEPKKEFEKFKALMEESLPDRSSTKHLSGRDLGRMEPTPSLRHQKAA